MKLNCEKNLLAYQKNIYSKLMFYHARLCDLYSNLAAINPSVESADEVKRMYSKPLSYAVAGDLDAIKDLNFSKEEFDIFEKYSYFAKKFEDYKELSETVKSVIESSDVQTIISEGKIVDPNFFTTNNSSPEIKDYNEETSKKTLNVISTQTSHTLRKAGKAIDRIDRHAIPKDKKLQTISPKSCGADISGPRTKNKHRNYKGNKHTNRKRFLTAVIASALIGIGGKFISDQLEYSNLSALENEKKGYELSVSDDTKSKLKNIDNALFLLKNSRIEPSSNVMNEIVEDLDTTIDNVISDLVTDAFNEKYPDYKVTDVSTSYDTSDSTPHNRVQNNYCTISYIGDNNKEEAITLKNFDEAILNSFKYEYLLDYQSDSLSIDDLQDICNNINHLAGTKIEFLADNNTIDAELKTCTPNKTNDKLNNIQTALNENENEIASADTDLER